VSVLAGGPEGLQVLTKGAPESLLAACTALDGPAGPIPLSGAARVTATDTFDTVSRASHHVLGVAWTRVAAIDQHTLTVDAERDLVLCGVVAFEDPPDPSTAQVIAEMRQSGARPGRGGGRH